MITGTGVHDRPESQFTIGNKMLVARVLTGRCGGRAGAGAACSQPAERRVPRPLAPGAGGLGGADLRLNRDFQTQIAEAAACDLVVGIVWTRAGHPIDPVRYTRADGTPR